MLSALWFVALVVAAIDALPAMLDGRASGPDTPAVVIAYGCAGVLLGACCVVLLRALARARGGRAAPRWARPLAFGCAAALAVAAVLGGGRPELVLMGFPALAFGLTGLALGRGRAG